MNKQEMKFWARMFENCPEMSSDVRQGWIENPKALQKLLSGLCPLNEASISNKYFRLLETVTLAPTKGVTIAEAKEVFRGHIDSDFKNWKTNITGEDTKETLVDVYEMKKNGTYQTLFSPLGNPRQLALSQGQIVEFCRTHHDSLRQGGYGTFFLFEVKDDLFVADVFVSGGELRVDVVRFDYGDVWGADDRRRLVVKQQTI